MIDKSLDRIIEKLNDEERLLLAENGFFVIKSDRSSVYCPEGKELYRKSIKKDGIVRYCRKSACPVCSSPCFPISIRRRFKEIDFSPRTNIKGDRERLVSQLKEMGLCGTDEED